MDCELWLRHVMYFYICYLYNVEIDNFINIFLTVSIYVYLHVSNYLFIYCNLAMLHYI